MLKDLFIIDDPLDFSANVHVQTENVIETLIERYGKAPATAKLYFGSVSKDNDITPQTEQECEIVLRMEGGPFFFVVYPADPITAGLVLLAGLAAVAIVASIPKIPTAAQRNIQTESPNNSLSERSNRARVNSRIPDIFGTVRSYPDLIATTYTTFENHIEVEHSYMCIGRGDYDFPLVDGVVSIRDGDTLASKIEGMKVSVFAPFTSPNSADSPQIEIGGAINELVVSARRSKAVNGQTLFAANDVTVANNFSNLVRFNFPNQIEIVAGVKDFTTLFAPADVIVVQTDSVYASLSAAEFTFGFGVSGITGAGTPQPVEVVFHPDGHISFTVLVVTGNPGPYVEITGAGDFNGVYRISSYTSSTLVFSDVNQSAVGWATLVAPSSPTTVQMLTKLIDPAFQLNGVYTVSAVTSTLLTLSGTPAFINTNWGYLPGLDIGGGDASYGSDGVSVFISLSAAGSDGWAGPFVTDDVTTREILVNFVAENGAWKDDGTTQLTSDVVLQLGVATCDAAGTLTGPETFHSVTLLGSDTTKNRRAATLRVSFGSAGRRSVRARRLTEKDTAYTGQVSDEVKWRDLYTISPVTETDFGNVTTVQAVTQATAGALSVAERQLNMLCTRKVPARVSGDVFSDIPTASNEAADILSFVCLDPKIGNRQKSEIDFDSIYDTASSVRSYFTVPQATEFHYTFDKANMSFEETIQIIANAMFCNAYRRGNVLQLFFERATNDSVLLFNHRNKVPRTEQRSRSFGDPKDHDGIEYEYVSPTDDKTTTFYVPEDRSAVNPERIESAGIRTTQQAYLHAYRAYNKQRYQRDYVSFDAMPEADIMVRGERMLVANGIRSGSQEGEVRGQSGLVLRLSQPVAFDGFSTYIIFLQHINGTLETTTVSAGATPYEVVLGGAPAHALVTDEDAVVRTLYIIVKNTETEKNAFLLAEKDYNENGTLMIKGVNYDSRYYQNDLDL